MIFVFAGLRREAGRGVRVGACVVLCWTVVVERGRGEVLGERLRESGVELFLTSTRSKRSGGWLLPGILEERAGSYLR